MGRIWIYISGPRHTNCVSSSTLPVGTCGLISDPATMPALQGMKRSQCRYSEWSKPWRGRSLTLSLGVSALGSICLAARALLCLSAFVCLCSFGSELFD